MVLAMSAAQQLYSTTDHAMSPERMRECLEIIGWSYHELGRRLNISERNCRRMGGGDRPITPALADWLETMVAIMEAAPQRPEGWRNPDY